MHWNSMFYMLQQLHEQQEPVGAAEDSPEADLSSLGSAEYEATTESREVLGPFSLTSTELSERKDVSA